MKNEKWERMVAFPSGEATSDGLLILLYVIPSLCHVWTYCIVMYSAIITEGRVESILKLNLIEYYANTSNNDLESIGHLILLIYSPVS